MKQQGNDGTGALYTFQLSPALETLCVQALFCASPLLSIHRLTSRDLFSIPSIYTGKSILRTNSIFDGGTAAEHNTPCQPVAVRHSKKGGARVGIRASCLMCGVSTHPSSPFVFINLDGETLKFTEQVTDAGD